VYVIDNRAGRTKLLQVSYDYTSFLQKENCPVRKHHGMKVYTGRECAAKHIFCLNIKWRWVGQFHVPAATLCERAGE